MTEQLTLALAAYVVQTPVLIAWLVGIVLCVVYRRRHPRASLLTSVALVLLIVESLMASYWGVALPELRGTRAEIGFALGLMGLFRASFRTFSWCLLLVAIFGSREGARAQLATDAAKVKDIRARPWAVTLVGWTLIALAVAGLIPFTFLPYGVQDPGLVGKLLFAGAFACLIQLSMGLGMLEGKNWARVLFLWLVPASLLVGVLGLGFGSGPRPSHAVRGAGYLAAVAILRRRLSQEWFQKHAA